MRFPGKKITSDESVQIHHFSFHISVTRSISYIYNLYMYINVIFTHVKYMYESHGCMP